MRALMVTEAPSALPNVIPFIPNYTVVAVNATATQELLQTADTIGGAYTTIATVPAGQAVEVVLNGPFVRLADAGFLILLGN